MSMNVISTDKAPAAIGHYEQAVIAGGFLYTSMQLPLIPGHEDQPIAHTMQEQTYQLLKNIKAILEAAEVGISSVVQVRLYLKSMDHFPIVNQVYESVMGAHKPARSVVVVQELPKGFGVAMEVVAHIEKSS